MLKENAAISGDEIQLLSRLREGDTAAFDEIYNHYWEKTLNYAYNLTKQEDIARDITQEIFVSLWVRKEAIDVQNSLVGYLFSAVRNQVVKHIRTSNHKEEYLKHFERYIINQPSNSTDENLLLNDLKKAIEHSLVDLPPRCRQIFEMSRFQNLSNSEIAEELKISNRTVENQLAIALKHLRISLPSFLFILFMSQTS